MHSTDPGPLHTGAVAKLEDASVYRRNPAVIHRDTLNGVLLLAPDSDEPVLVTSPGDVVWELLERPTAFGELVMLLADAYKAPAEQVANDIAPLLDELCTMHVVERATRTPTPGD